MLNIIPDSLDDLNNKIQGYIKDLNRPEGAEMAGIYTRVSRIDHRAHGYSMEIQPDRSEEYAKSKGWAVYQIYEDPARTGRNSRRPELQHMINDIKAGRITIVIVHRLDRLYRNLESLLRFLRMIKRYRVRLVSVTEQIDTDNWWGRLVLYVLGALAEMYIWQTSARTREAKLERVMRGLSNASYRFGYCNGLCATCTDPNGPGYCPLAGQPDRPESQRGRIPVPHPIEAEVVRLIVQLYAQGFSDREIADHLNRHKFRLSNGEQVCFRTKGIPSKSPPGPFGRDNVREIVRSPFYVGLVAHYPTRPLDMEDDPEKARTRTVSVPLVNKREPQLLVNGQHQALYDSELWKRNMQRRNAKAKTPQTRRAPVHNYLLTGIGRCYVCYKHGNHRVTLRGSKNGNGYTYYRCGVLMEHSKKHLKEIPGAFSDGATLNLDWQTLIDAHTGNLPAEKLEQQVVAMVKRFVIPPEWRETILAYYLGDEGMAEYERMGYNLRQELARLQALYTEGFINRAQFDDQARTITQELRSLQPSAKPEARAILPMLNDFAAAWDQLAIEEKRTLLKNMFVAIYYDDKGQIKKVLANEPFDELLSHLDHP